MTWAAHHLGLLLAVAAAQGAVRRWPMARLLRLTAALDRLRPDRAVPLPAARLRALARATLRAARVLGVTCLPSAFALRWWLRVAFGQRAEVVIALRRVEDGAAGLGGAEGVSVLGHAWLRVEAAEGEVPLLHGPGEDHGVPLREARLRAASAGAWSVR